MDVGRRPGELLPQSIVRKLFPPGAQGTVRALPESAYSVTPPAVARLVASTLARYCAPGPCDTVVDGTAHVGGLTIALAQKFGRVVACEINQATARVLRANLRAYGLLPRVTVVEGDASTLRATADAVVFDPPWGGPEYKKKKSLSLQLGGRDVGELAREWVMQRRARVAAVFCPFNFHLSPRAIVGVQIVAIRVKPRHPQSPILIVFKRAPAPAPAPRGPAPRSRRGQGTPAPAPTARRSTKQKSVSGR